MWVEVITDQDIKCFLDQINYFADSCIKEMHYVSGSHAQDGKSLYAVNDRRDLYILFHSISSYVDMNNCKWGTERLNKDYISFEIKFSGIHKAILEPYLADCDSVIYDVTLVKKDGLFYWYDYKEDHRPGFTPKGTMVAAEKMSWRMI